MEVGGLLRRMSASGDFGTVLRKGDEDRGSIILVISSRGRHAAIMERVLTTSGDYIWQRSGPTDSVSSNEIRDFLDNRARFDEDLWVIELDIADPERFIAETIASP